MNKMFFRFKLTSCDKMVRNRRWKDEEENKNGEKCMILGESEREMKENYREDDKMGEN